MKKYFPYRKVVTPEFRHLVRSHYPGLDRSPVFWKMMEHALLGLPRSCSHGQVIELLLTREMMAEFAGIRNASHCRLSQWIERFEKEVGMALNPKPYSYVDHKATAIEPKIHPAILSARDEEMRSRTKRGPRDGLDFVTGRTVTTRSRRQQIKTMEDVVKDAVMSDAADRPSEKLLEYLNSDSGVRLSHTLDRNWENLLSQVEEMPSGERKEHVKRCVDLLAETCRHIYRPAERSARVFPIGVSLLTLPREIRHIGLSGTITLDLRACQLAIAARIWDMPTLVDFLESGQSWWEYLGGVLHLPLDAKPALKTLTYSTLFGKGRQNLYDEAIELLGEIAGGMFWSVPEIQELRAARKKVYAQISADGGAYDAFGSWLPVGPDREPHAIACSVVQSHEMRLMLLALEEVIREPDLHILLWAHDGCNLECDATGKKRENILRRVEMAINIAAGMWGFPTVAEISQ